MVKCAVFFFVCLFVLSVFALILCWPKCLSDVHLHPPLTPALLHAYVES